MKNKGIVFSIMIIFILGVAVTSGTSRYISTLREEDRVQEAAEAASEEAGTAAAAVTSAAEEEISPPEPEAFLPEPEKEPEKAAGDLPQQEEKVLPGGMNPLAAPAPSAPVPETAETETDGALPDTGVISPLTGAPGRGTAREEKVTLEGSRKRLEDIDETVSEMRAANVNGSPDSVRNATDYEYRLWDAELNRIYQAVILEMDEDEKKRLREEEREWIALRDETARETASRYRGGTLEGVEYMASLAASTRSRAYELLDQYGSVLPE